MNPLDQLSPEQSQTLADWLLNGLSFSRALLQIQQEFSIAANTTDLSAFWDIHCTLALIDRRTRAANVAKEITNRLSQSTFTDAALELLQQHAFELMIAPQPDIKNIQTIITLLLKIRDQQLEERKITLNEKKHKNSDSETTLTPEEHKTRMREIFGITAAEAA